ncbi:ATP-binding protein [Acidithrix sp. C25]|uniref:sensor histidine kinase n=1 Tax=Acidithrix sp. C25 TaxID=1671482 RepID=UPI00191BB7C3|nr:ATP-binding protein [Acidithrix sp. C25]CAG4933841.1 unnamed protein product [Acidithrix sp. C25]
MDDSIENIVSGGNEDELRFEVESLRSALDSVSQAVFIHDSSGGTYFANQVAKELENARHEEAGLMRAINEAVDSALNGRFKEQSFSIFGPPKRDFIIRTTSVGERLALGVITIVDDLTVRNQLDTIRRDFVANVSHELRTPIGALGLLAETLAFEDEPSVRQRLANRIQNEAFRVAKIIDDLLDLSRFESEGAASISRVSMPELAMEVIDQISPAAELQRVTIDLRLNSEDTYVLGDRGQLRSALTNLIDNSVKYSEPNSSVLVEISQNNSTVTVAVVDHGIGIPQKDIERIFERFYRVDQARSRQTGGTGLGLSIVRHAISNHNGTIEVDSREGAGSTFKIHLPIEPGANQ